VEKLGSEILRETFNYDNLGNIQNSNKRISNKNFTYDYDFPYEFLETDKEKSSGVNYSASNLYEDFNYITLRGSLESTDKTKPLNYIKSDNIDELFKYDKSLKHFVYASYNNNISGNKSILKYKLPLNKEKGTIMFWVKPDYDNTFRDKTLITLEDSLTKKVKRVYLNREYRLIYETDNFIHETTTFLEYDKWN